MPIPKDAIREAKEKGAGRKFTQSLDIIVSIKQLDLKKPENNFSMEVQLPAGRGRPARVGVIGSGLAAKAKDTADVVIDEKALADIEKDAKKLRQLSKDVDFLVAEAPLMMRIGKSLGKVLGPRGKMPRPHPPQADILAVVKKLKETVKLTLKGNPTISCSIGIEKMPDEDIEKNMHAAVQALEKKFPLGRQNIKDVFVKSTMGPPVRVENY